MQPKQKEQRKEDKPESSSGREENGANSFQDET